MRRLRGDMAAVRGSVLPEVCLPCMWHRPSVVGCACWEASKQQAREPSLLLPARPVVSVLPQASVCMLCAEDAAVRV